MRNSISNFTIPQIPLVVKTDERGLYLEHNCKRWRQRPETYVSNKVVQWWVKEGDIVFVVGSAAFLGTWLVVSSEGIKEDWYVD